MPVTSQSSAWASRFRPVSSCLSGLLLFAGVSCSGQIEAPPKGAGAAQGSKAPAPVIEAAHVAPHGSAAAPEPQPENGDTATEPAPRPAVSIIISPQNPRRGVPAEIGLAFVADAPLEATARVALSGPASSEHTIDLSLEADTPEHVVLHAWQPETEGPATWRAEVELPDTTLIAEHTVQVGPARPSFSLFGMNLDLANPAGRPKVEALQAAGVRNIRFEWKASFDPERYQRWLGQFHDAGIRSLVVFDYASVAGAPGSDAPLSAWRAFIPRYASALDDVAQSVGPLVDAWQIWNEPDLHHPGELYDPGVPAVAYGEMLDAARAVLSSRAPSALVVTGGLATANPAYLAAAGGTQASFDVIAIHPYGRRAPDDWPSPTWGFGNMSELLYRWLAFGKPVWLTETGLQTAVPQSAADEQFQADYLHNVYRLLLDHFSGRVEAAFWFCWADGMVEPFGIHGWNGQPHEQKASYHRYRALAHPTP